jgi:nucleotide-binding universal stress UspA family protein
MTAVRTKAIGEQSDATHPGRRAGEAKARTQKVLAVVDGSERTGHVLEYLIGMADSGVPIEVVVLNVQPAPEDWRLRGYGSFKQDEVHDRLVNDLGKPIVESVGRRLDQRDIAHKDRIELGELAETILRCANEECCDLIVVSEPRAGSLRRWLTRTTGLSLGSLASNVVQLAEMPVIVVK